MNPKLKRPTITPLKITQVNLRIDETLANKLTEKSRALGMSRNALINTFIRHYLGEKK
jgi:predicted HicB family RNase H-like nuclease